MRGCYYLNVDSLQLLSTSLGVQVLVVVSGRNPDVPDDNSWENDKQGLVLGSSEDVEHGVVQVALQRSGGIRRNGVGSNVFLGWGTHVTPPSHVSSWTGACHFEKIEWLTVG